MSSWLFGSGSPSPEDKTGTGSGNLVPEGKAKNSNGNENGNPKPKWGDNMNQGSHSGSDTGLGNGPGGNMFQGLMLKTTATGSGNAKTGSSNNIPTSQRMRSGSNVSTTSSVVSGSGFSFMSTSTAVPATTASAASSASTGFSFINQSAAGVPPQTRTSTGNTGFSFLNQKPKSALNPQRQEQLDEVQKEEDLADLNATITESPITFNPVQPRKVKKKRALGKTPGFARTDSMETEPISYSMTQNSSTEIDKMRPASIAESVSEELENAKKSEPSTSDTPGSLLAGLTIHSTGEFLPEDQRKMDEKVIENGEQEKVVESGGHTDPDVVEIENECEHGYERGNEDKNGKHRDVLMGSEIDADPHNVDIHALNEAVEMENDKQVEADRIQENVEGLKQIEAVTHDKETENVSIADSSTLNEEKAVNVSDSEILDSEMIELLIAFRRTATRYIKEMSSVNVKKRTFLEDRNEKETQMKEIVSRIAKTESEQNMATEKEEYEEAERLQNEIDKLGREKGILESSLYQLTRNENENMENRLQIMQTEISSLLTVRALLSECSAKEIARAQEIVDNAESTHNLEIRQMDEREDVLRIQSEHVEKDLEIVKEEQDQINEKMSSGTKELRVVQEEWAAKVDKANSELEELRRLMIEKEAELSQYTKALSEVEGKISNVHKKYEIRLTELEKRMNEVKERQTRNIENCDNIKQKREEAKQKFESTVNMGNKIADNANSIAAQLIVLEKMASRMQSELEENNKDVDTLDSASEENTHLEEQLKNLREQVDVNAQSIDFNRRQADQAKRRIVENTASMMEIRSTLPTLQDQKKYAVSTRNFKEAGRVANQIKQLQSEEEEKEASITADKESLKDFEQLISEAESKLKENLTLKNQLERKLELHTINLLKSKKSQLVEDIKHIKSLGPVDKGTFGNTVVDLFSFEMEACDVAAMNIANKLNDESLAELVLSIHDNEIDNNAVHTGDGDGNSVEAIETVKSSAHANTTNQEENGKEIENLDEVQVEEGGSAEEQEKISTQPEQVQEKVANICLSEESKTTVESIIKLESDIVALAEEIELAVVDEEYETAADLEEKANQMKQEIVKLKESIGGEERFLQLVVEIETEIVRDTDNQSEPKDDRNNNDEPEDEAIGEDLDDNHENMDNENETAEVEDDSDSADHTVDDVPHLEGSF